MNDLEFTTLYPRLAAALSNVEHEAKPRAQFTIDTPTGEQTLRQYVTEAATGIAFYALLCVGLVLAVALAGWPPVVADRCRVLRIGRRRRHGRHLAQRPGLPARSPRATRYGSDPVMRLQVIPSPRENADKLSSAELVDLYARQADELAAKVEHAIVGENERHRLVLRSFTALLEHLGEQHTALDELANTLHRGEHSA